MDTRKCIRPTGVLLPVSDAQALTEMIDTAQRALRLSWELPLFIDPKLHTDQTTYQHYRIARLVIRLVILFYAVFSHEELMATGGVWERAVHNPSFRRMARLTRERTQPTAEIENRSLSLPPLIDRVVCMVASYPLSRMRGILAVKQIQATAAEIARRACRLHYEEEWRKQHEESIDLYGIMRLIRGMQQQFARILHPRSSRMGHTQAPEVSLPKIHTWSRLRMMFTSPTEVDIFCGGSFFDTLTFSQMGFGKQKNKRKGNIPKDSWKLLHYLATHNGTATIDCISHNFGCDHKKIKNILADLNAQFRICFPLVPARDYPVICRAKTITARFALGVNSIDRHEYY